MPKGPIKFQGPNWVVLTSRSPGRGGVLQDLKTIGTPAVNFIRFFRRESDLPGHLAQRCRTTVFKSMYLPAQLFAEGKFHPSIMVGGARLQDRSGNSQRVDVQGQKMFTGMEAGHVGIGTYTVNGKTIGADAMEFLVKTARQQQEKMDGLKAFRQLTAFGTALDGETEMVPAFFNRTSGLIETTTQLYMKGLLPAFIPADPASLEHHLKAIGYRTADLLVNKKVSLIRPMENRLLSLRQGTGMKEFRQDPADTDNALFEGKESIALEAMLEQLTDNSSDFHSEMHRLFNDIALFATEFAEKAQAAREELTA